MNGNTDFFKSRVYLWNTSTAPGDLTARIFTLPVTGDPAQELAAPLPLPTLEARSALNLKVAEDILTPAGITPPYTNTAGNLTLEFSIQAPRVQGAAQVFNNSQTLAFGTYPLQETSSTSSANPTVLVANFMNGNTDFFKSRVYLWNTSNSAGNVTVRVFTLPRTGGPAQELTSTPRFLGTLGAESALNLRLEDILDDLLIPRPYVTDSGNLTLEFTIGAAGVRGAAQVFNNSLTLAFGTYPLQETSSTPSADPTVLVANFMNGNTDFFKSRVYLWNPATIGGDVTVRVFTLPRTGDPAQELTSTPLPLGTLGAESALNIRLEDILDDLLIPRPYVTDSGNLTLEFTIGATGVRGAAQVFNNSQTLAFGTYPLQETSSTPSADPTVLVANFMNGNTDFFKSRVYLWNPATIGGDVTVRVFTLPLLGDTPQELTSTPRFLGTLGAESALNIRLEDILDDLLIPRPYTTDSGNLTLEFTIGAAGVRGAAQVFNNSQTLAFGTYTLSEAPE
jgi:hypothetical protein